MALAVALLGGVNRLYLDTRILNELEEELELRALSFARYLGAESVNLVLRQDFVGLHKLLNDARSSGSDVEYAFIMDPTNKVLVHTFESDFPEQLTLLNRYREHDGYQVQRIEIFSERFRDFAVPLYHGELGVLRLGVRDGRILARVTSVRRELTLVLSAVMALSAAAAYLLTYFGLRPLAAITGALERFEPGQRCETIVPRRDDEVGDLATKVNLVTARLHNSHTQMMQTEKMVAAGLLASGIAHEINNPISGLQNCLRRIQAKPEDVPQIKEYTAVMLQAAEHIGAVVHGLLDFSRSTPKQMLVIDLRGVLTKALHLTAFRIEKNQIELQQAIPEDPVWVRGEEAQLVQVVVNVLLNAIDAMEAGGVLQLMLEREDGQIVLRVRDDGVGVAPEHLSRVFEPFFTTKGSGKGTGLGLAVTQGIILDHDGRIAIDSSPGVGTEVKIQLPLWRQIQRVGHEAA
ncbi:MAG: HAMP domain-containing histidine kinase [Deltaproteobacteria bacterium]|nr:HAMP domain-containing histidine kinase [Deltaproteobacteria bacterium]